MTMNKAFPTAICILSLAAALAYIPSGDWRRVVYWLAAAAITAVVTW
jgi:hypothetical protein